MKNKFKVIALTIIGITSIIITFFSVRYVRTVTSDKSWISDFEYQDGEIYKLSFDRVGIRECPKIEVQINSKKYNLFLDTGCERGFTLTDKLESKVNYTLLGQKEELNRDGTHRGWSKYINVNEVSIFGQKYQDVQTTMIPWSMTSSEPYDGLVGIKYFQSRVVTIDYYGNRIGIKDTPINYESLDKDKYVVLPLYKNVGQENLPFFEANMDGEPIMVYLDTGKNYSFIQDSTSTLGIGDKPKGFERDVDIYIDDMELKLNDVVGVGSLAQGESLPYPVMIELNSDQIWKSHLIVTFDLINQKIIFNKH